MSYVVWFLVGNIWYFGSKTCRSTNPEVYYGTLSALILYYIYVAEIVLLAILVVFFLPLVIVSDPPFYMTLSKSVPLDWD